MSERHLVGPQAVHGTTHVSVVDAEGNLAAMTTSNGSCSGQFAPGTGIQLNNVMGEADLHPDGFHVTAPGTRIGSMMAPTVVTTANGSLIGLGSGGSERIRSALTCVLTGAARPWPARRGRRGRAAAALGPRAAAGGARPAAGTSSRSWGGTARCTSGTAPTSTSAARTP